MTQPLDKQFRAVLAAVEVYTEDAAWLARRSYHADGRTKLCDQAEAVFPSLSGQPEWPSYACAQKVAQDMPIGLQPAYFCCLLGYTGNKPLEQYAAEVLQCILSDVKQAAERADFWPRQEPSMTAAAHGQETSFNAHGCVIIAQGPPCAMYYMYVYQGQLPNCVKQIMTVTSRVQRASCLVQLLPV